MMLSKVAFDAGARGDVNACKPTRCLQIVEGGCTVSGAATPCENKAWSGKHCVVFWGRVGARVEILTFFDVTLPTCPVPHLNSIV